MSAPVKYKFSRRVIWQYCVNQDNDKIEKIERVTIERIKNNSTNITTMRKISNETFNIGDSVWIKVPNKKLIKVEILGFKNILNLGFLAVCKCENGTKLTTDFSISIYSIITKVVTSK